MWTPTACMVLSNNAKTAEVNEITPQTNYVMVHNDGNCGWAPRFERSVSHCDVDVTWFPFDVQRCQLVFESWVLTDEQLDITTYGETDVLNNYLPSEEWNLTSVEMTVGVSEYNMTDYPTVTFTLHLHRQPLYYVVNLILPCCLLSFIAVATFLLQPGCFERLGIAVTILLAMSVYQIIISDKLPSSSTSIPIIVVYFMFLIGMCILAVVLTIVVQHLYLRSETKPFVPMPIWMKNLFCERLAACLCMNQSPFPSMGRSPTTILSADIANRFFDNDDQSMKNLLEEIRDLLKRRVQNEEDRRREADKQNEMRNDWMLAAAVLDRICAIAVTVAFVGGTVIFFVVFVKHP